MEKHHPVFTTILLLNILQSTGRLFFAILGLSGGMKQFLDVSISPATDGFLLLMFFILGISGYIAIYGVWQQRPWGIKGILFVSGLTILFDIWGLTIQTTAALGFIVPLCTILFIYAKKSQIPWGKL